MALLAPITSAELDATVATLATLAARSGAARGRAERRGLLRELHEALIRSVPTAAAMPSSVLAAATEIAGQYEPGVADSMQPRIRTVYRLLRAGVPNAAWAVLAENSVGVVDDLGSGPTATGTRPTLRRLPLLTRIEPPTVFADLPGFRDPRHRAPDDCYDISELVRLRATLDDLEPTDGAVVVGGSAALDHLRVGPDDRVRLVLAGTTSEIAVDGHRHRRPDQFPGSAHLPLRREWAGWSARIDLTDTPVPAGEWALLLELERDGIGRRAAVTAASHGPVVAIDGRPLTVRRTSMRVRLVEGNWQLAVGEV